LNGSRKNPAVRMDIMIFQDSATRHMPTIEEYGPPLTQIADAAKARGVKLILCTTGFDRLPTNEKDQRYKLWKGVGDAWANINVLMRKFQKERGIDIIPLDITGARYVEHTKTLSSKEARQWSRTGRYIDHVHPRGLGKVFMAMNIARDLGVPPEKLDVEKLDFGVEQEVIKNIRDFVYSWKDSTIFPLPIRPVEKGKK